ncbi:MAG: class I SAM-dependent RNA methyltransferase [Blastomonas sp.]
MPVNVAASIVRIAARGDGVTADGQHVPGAVTGDSLLEGGGIDWGKHHVAPPCAHFGDCGGCQLQHADETVLAAFVHDRVMNALDGKGVIPADVRPVHLSPPASRRRATLAFQRMEGRLLLGYYSAGSHRIVAVRECPVLTPRLHDVIPKLADFLHKWSGKRLSGTVEMTLAEQGVDMLIHGLDPASLSDHERLNAFAGDNGLARFAIDRGDGPETLWEPEPVTIGMQGIAVALPHGAFLQPSQDGEDALIAAASEALAGCITMADLFAGIGTFALRLRQAGRRIYAAEAARDAILALKGAANRHQLPVFADHRDLFRNPLRPAELNRFDGVLLDPPRAGARDQVEQLAASDVARICYVSCNPATFARDAQLLCANGYALQTLWPVGQFRWSTHVELVSLFVRK